MCTHTLGIFVPFGVELDTPVAVGAVAARLSPLQPALPKLSEPKGSANGSLEGGVLLSSWLPPPPPNGSPEALSPPEVGMPNGSPPTAGGCTRRERCIRSMVVQLLWLMRNMHWPTTVCVHIQHTAYHTQMM